LDLRSWGWPRPRAPPPPPQPPPRSNPPPGRTREEQEAHWDQHLAARSALIAQVEWEPAPPDLNPSEFVDGDNFLSRVRTYVETIQSNMRDLKVGEEHAYSSFTKGLRPATEEDDAAFAATRFSPVPLTSRRFTRPFVQRVSYIPPEDYTFWLQFEDGTRRLGIDEQLRSEVGPANASYLHSKTATLVDTDAVLYKSDMEARYVVGYRRNLPPGLQPFYEMELRCDPSRVAGRAFCADIQMQNPRGDTTLQAKVLCVCRTVERFRAFRGDDNDNDRLSAWPLKSFDAAQWRAGGQGPPPAYVILTAIRMRALDGRTFLDRLAVDDFVVVDKNFRVLDDLRSDPPNEHANMFDPTPSFVNTAPLGGFGRPAYGSVLRATRVLSRVPLTLDGDCFHNWNQLRRAVRSVGPALAEARERAAERVYAPGAEGAKDARANFERLAREQEREKQRQRDREAREAQQQSPRRATGTMPSLAALRV